MPLRCIERSSLTFSDVSVPSGSNSGSATLINDPRRTVKRNIFLKVASNVMAQALCFATQRYKVELRRVDASRPSIGDRA